MRRIWIVGGVLLGGCVTTATGPGEREFRGYYSQGFEVDSFRACGERQSWWVREGADLRTRYAGLAEREYAEVFVVLRGEITAEGSYGHLGAYTRELSVSRVLELRPAGAGDCP